MKLAISQKIHEGPWGGGNNFVKAVKTRMEERGHTVVQSLDDDDIDLILLIDPRSRNPLMTFVAGDILRYLLRHPNAVVVHRINECDERKNTKTMNFRLKLANYSADHTVFIASWLKKLDLWQAEPTSRCSVILNGADTAVFNSTQHVPWDGQAPLKIVTHHWGANWAKGFDVYERLDDMLATNKWRERIDFTYIGNLPSGFSFKNAHHLPPSSGEALAAALSENHLYVTASLNEPAGMHHIEGALCGLPLLYRNSGGLPEYCSGYGVSFEGPQDFEIALETVIASYDDYKAQLDHYPHTAAHMADTYCNLFEDLVQQRQEIAKTRRIWRNPWALLLNQFPI